MLALLILFALAALWYEKSKCTSLSHRAVYLDFASVHFHETVADGQTQASSLMSAGVSAVNLVKGLKYRGQGCFWDANAAVGDLKLDGWLAIELSRVEGHGDSSTFRGEFDSITKQVEQYLSKLDSICV